MYRNERRKNKSQIKTAWIENGIVDAVVYESLLPLNDFTDDLQRLHRHSMWQFLRVLKFYLIRLISNALYTIIWLVNQNSGKCKCRYCRWFLSFFTLLINLEFSRQLHHVFLALGIFLSMSAECKVWHCPLNLLFTHTHNIFYISIHIYAKFIENWLHLECWYLAYSL